MAGAMAISSFLAGSLPLSLSLSQRKSRLLSALGSGVLVGSSLTVIVPEGIEVLYGPRTSSQHTPGENSAKPMASDKEPHAWVGLSLMSGFLLMYLIDRLPQHSRQPHFAPSRQPFHISLSDLSQGSLPLRAAASADDETGTHQSVNASSARSHMSSTSIGLIIHAAADGIALGASTSASTTGLGLVVFIAIMVHKMPAAFGLTSVLLKQGLSKRSARAHLLVFSLAAPAAAIVTWIVVNMIGQDQTGGKTDVKSATGVLLLFSGGTFLYVAMRAMQEAPDDLGTNAGVGFHDMQLSDSIVHVASQKPHSMAVEGALAVVGMLLPSLTQVRHTH